MSQSKAAAQRAGLNKFLLSSTALWFWLTIVLAIATVVAVFTVAQSDYPFVYLRQIFGAIFVLFLPGFVFMKALYPSELPIEASSENLDIVERVTLSFGVSITLAAMTGLILNYTPWGIRLTPITLSLLALTLIFGAVAVLQEYQANSHQACKLSK